MRRSAALLLVAMLGGCSSGGESAFDSDAHIAQATWDSYCSRLSEIQDVFGGLSKGTLTNAEAVRKLAAAQERIEGSALVAVDDGHPSTGAKMDAVATAVGRLKVAIDDGRDIPAAEFGEAIKALPDCSSPPPAG